MDLHENECTPLTRPSHKERTLYDELQKELPEEQFKKFNNFLDLHDERLAEECEIYFKKGFQFAMRLILECCNEKF